MTPAPSELSSVRAVELLRNAYSALVRADNSSGVCCCGDYMVGHSYTEHTPTDSGIRYADNLMLDIRNAIKLED